MKIMPVSFPGRDEILSYTKRVRRLSNEEKTLVEKACAFHELEREQTGDGDFLANPPLAKQTTNEYLDALNKAGASKLSYMIAVDSLSAPVVGLSVQKEDIVKRALDIAKDATRVSKQDILRDFDKLASKWY